jgi:hypothetical protein
MAKSGLRPVCTFKAESNIGKFITQSYAIVKEMSEGAYFTAPPIPYLSVSGHIENLQTAETFVKTRAIGSVSARNIVNEVVLDDLRSYQNFVQYLADQTDDYLTKIAIIKASGFKLKNSSASVKLPLRAKQGGSSGEVKLHAKMAAKRATYYWQISLDGGETYSNLGDSMEAKVTFNGLTTVVKTFFRFRAKTKEGFGKWSEAVVIILE